MNTPTLTRSGLSRRDFLKGAGLAASAVMLPNMARASLPASASQATLKFYNIHTDEKLTATFIDGGQYVPDAVTAIDHILRDFRTNEVAQMDLNLLNLLTALHQHVGSHQPFEVISGYRSPRTNAMLHERSNGVAKHSLHMEARAIDIRLKDVSLRGLRNAAIGMGRGGVGYYAASDFVHVDTGRVRTW